MLAAAAAALYVLVLAQAPSAHQDFDTYAAAGRNLVAGRPLYAGFLRHPFPDPALRPAYIYPPVFAVLIAPFAFLPAGLWGWLILTQSALAGSLALILRCLRATHALTFLAVCATLTFYPLWVDAVQGQANLLVLFLTCIGIALIVGGRPAGGVSIGIAAALKLTPFLLLFWLFVDRRFRAAAFVLGGFAGATALGAMLRFDDTLTFFRSVAPQLARGSAFYGNQSLGGVMARVFTSNAYTTPWLMVPGELAVVICGGVALLAWWVRSNRGQDDALRRALTFLPLLALLSSVTWAHHLVLLLPLIWLGIAALARRRWPLAQTAVLVGILGCFDLLSRWQPGPGFKQPGFQAAQTADPLVLISANALFLGTLLLFLCAPWLLRSR